MATSLETKLRTQASAYAPLTALLGNPFRWYDSQLLQGSLYPAIVVMQVSGSPTYVQTGRLPTGFTRIQFTIWDTDSERARRVEAALESFLDQFNAIGIPGLVQYPNEIVLQRAGYFAEPAPALFQRINDAMIFSNSNL
jgi:hypothetical protein